MKFFLLVLTLLFVAANGFLWRQWQKRDTGAVDDLARPSPSPPVEFTPPPPASFTDSLPECPFSFAADKPEVADEPDPPVTAAPREPENGDQPKEEKSEPVPREPEPWAGLRYRGYLVAPDGRPIALIEDADTRRTIRLRVGGSIRNLTITAISRTGIDLRDGEGRTPSLPLDPDAGGK